jgi:hypothetical protein
LFYFVKNIDKTLAGIIRINALPMYFAIRMLITIPKKVLNGNFHTVRPVGRTRTRWTDVVQRDARQLLRIRGWRSKAANMDEWRRLMREAKARKGL